MPDEVYDASEQSKVVALFSEMLWEVTKDGGTKRASGEKPPWYHDDSHEAAIFSHLNKWKHGETRDEHSGAHPLVHLAWRALAIAWQETHCLACVLEGEEPWGLKALSEDLAIPRQHSF